MCCSALQDKPASAPPQLLLAVSPLHRPGAFGRPMAGTPARRKYGFQTYGNNDSFGSRPGDSMSSSTTEIRVKGKATTVPSTVVQGRNVLANGKWIGIAGVQDEELVV